MANEKIFEDAATEDENLGSESLYLGGINAPKPKVNKTAGGSSESEIEPEQYDAV